MALVDLTSRISPFLDRHLVFPLLEFLQERHIYPEDEILKAKIELLGKTNMVDYAMDIHKSLYRTEDVPQPMVERRAEVVGRMKHLEEQAAAIIGFLQDPALVAELRPDKQHNLRLLEESYQIGSEQIEALYSYAKFQFECGNYSGAADFLYQYRLLASGTERLFSATWGKLAAEILTQNWDSAVEELNRLREMVDSRSLAPPAEVLQQRTWLMHWALFVLLASENGRSEFIDLLLQDKYLNALQMNAPHLLRYLAAAVMTCRRRRSSVKEVVRVLQQEEHAYSDPITRFMISLFALHDFDEAQARLRECEELLQQDFFFLGHDAGGYGTAAAFRDEFVDAARLFIFETYCRLHRRLEIKLLADKLDMSVDAAERWICNLIRTAKLDARIDSESGTVVMTTPQPNIYETLIESTQALTQRSYMLTSNVITAAVAINR